MNDVHAKMGRISKEGETEDVIHPFHHKHRDFPHLRLMTDQPMLRKLTNAIGFIIHIVYFIIILYYQQPYQINLLFQLYFQ